MTLIMTTEIMEMVLFRLFAKGIVLNISKDHLVRRWANCKLLRFYVNTFFLFFKKIKMQTYPNSPGEGRLK